MKTVPHIFSVHMKLTCHEKKKRTSNTVHKIWQNSPISNIMKVYDALNNERVMLQALRYTVLLPYITSLSCIIIIIHHYELTCAIHHLYKHLNVPSVDNKIDTMCVFFLMFNSVFFFKYNTELNKCTLSWNELNFLFPFFFPPSICHKCVNAK
jgi:hypothetical protein